MNVMTEFTQVLTQENSLLEQLITLGEQKKAHIKDVSMVANIASQEQKLLAALEQVESDRAELFDVVGQGQSLREWLAQDRIEGNEELVEEIAALGDNLSQLRSLNEINKQLMEESLTLVQFSLSLLVDQTPKTYARDGRKAETKSFFDRKV